MVAVTDSLLKISDVAKILGVSIPTLRRWHAEGKLKPVWKDLHGTRYYRPQDVAAVKTARKA